uniref:Uncharacterized protein n=1 Tax=Candidatus Kentrum sp. FW TaxID=2126338 RepID=A0A450T8D6_9GAMM|nr:MAG: hypothetical protein BECKFW1821B_GA0114236_107716 [Candidatus Kentron sp. FW]
MKNKAYYEAEEKIQAALESGAMELDLNATRSQRPRWERDFGSSSFLRRYIIGKQGVGSRSFPETGSQAGAWEPAQGLCVTPEGSGAAIEASSVVDGISYAA